MVVNRARIPGFRVGVRLLRDCDRDGNGYLIDTLAMVSPVSLILLERRADLLQVLLPTLFALPKPSTLDRQ